MRVTVIKSDNRVYVGGEALEVDCSDLPSYFHAIQWYGDASPSYGEIEYAADDQGRRLPNTRFSDFTPYLFLVDRWNVAKAEQEADQAEQAAVLAARAAAAALEAPDAA